MPHRLLVLLFALIAVPWYWSLLPAAWAMYSVAGLPLWAVVSVAASLGVSVHTATLFAKPWPNEEDLGAGSAGESQTGDGA